MRTKPPYGGPRLRAVLMSPERKGSVMVKTVTLVHPSNDVKRHLMARPMIGTDKYEVVSWRTNSYRYEARTTHPEYYAFLALDEIIRYMSANGWVIWMGDRCCTDGLVCCCNIRTCSCTCAGCMCDTN